MDKDLQFWDDQYLSELAEPFDWFFTYVDMQHEWWKAVLEGIRSDGSGPTDQTPHILMLGCGHSSLSADLVHHGWPNVVSMDSSPAVVSLMASKHPAMTWVVGDARDLQKTLPAPHGDSERYDVVLDKGLLDAIFVYRNNTMPSTKQTPHSPSSPPSPSGGGSGACGGAVARDNGGGAAAAAAAAARDAWRVLKPGGRFVVISCLRGDSKDDNDGAADDDDDDDDDGDSFCGDDWQQSRGGGGRDGYGGGRVKAISVLRQQQRQHGKQHPLWASLSYRELPNPRMQPQQQQGTAGSGGGIAPQFADVCPTHYAIIIAVKGPTSSPPSSPPLASSLAAGELTGGGGGQGGQGKSDRSEATSSPPPSSSLSSSSSPTSPLLSPPSSSSTVSPSSNKVDGNGSFVGGTGKSESNSSDSTAETTPATLACHRHSPRSKFETDEPSLQDYDDYYSGRLMLGVGEGGGSKVEVEVEAPPPHDAFVSWEGLRSRLEPILEAAATEKMQRAHFSSSAPLPLEHETHETHEKPDEKHDEEEQLSNRYVSLRVLDIGCGSSSVGAGLAGLKLEISTTGTLPALPLLSLTSSSPPSSTAIDGACSSSSSSGGGGGGGGGSSASSCVVRVDYLGVDVIPAVVQSTQRRWAEEGCLSPRRILVADARFLRRYLLSLNEELVDRKGGGAGGGVGGLSCVVLDWLRQKEEEEEGGEHDGDDGGDAGSDRRRDPPLPASRHRRHERLPPPPSLPSSPALLDGCVDVVFDKGTADALMLFDDPNVAMEAYLNEVASLLRQQPPSPSPRQSSDDEINRERIGVGRGLEGLGGLFVVVTCLREKGFILNGHGKPRILKHLERRRADQSSSSSSNSSLRVVQHEELLSDVWAAGTTNQERTYDLLVLALV